MTDESATGGAAVVTNAPAAAPRGARLGRALHTDLSDLISRLSLLLFLAALVIYFGVSAEHFASTNNAWIILQAIAVIGIVSIGQTLAIVSGGFDLSTSGVVPLGSILFAQFSNAGHGVLGSLVLTLLVGAGIGLINGVVITKLRINPLIATLGMLSIAAGAAGSIANGVSIPLDDTDINILGTNSVGDIANSVWAFLVLAVVAAAICRFTLFGRSLYSIGGNREASWLAGLRVDRVTILVYVISGTLAALAGVILTSQLLTGSTTVGTDSALTSIAAVVLGGGSLAGGVGTIGGTIVGVLILGVFQNGLQLMHVAPFYQQIATGAILLLAVAFSQLRQMDLGHRLRFARSRRP
jgi:ribose/xylose/arabinose/galactoside ABC-type transport system permease subunit